jgi:hypothetical protein
VLAGIAAWPLAATERDLPWMLAGLFALAPGLGVLARDPAPPGRAHVVGWTAMVALLSTVAALDDVGGAWMLLPAALFGALSASAALLPGPAWCRPAGVTGALGAAVLCVVLSAAGAWEGGLHVDRDGVLGLTLAASLGVGALGGAGWLASRGRIVEALVPAVPLLALAAFGLARGVDPLAAAIAVDVVVGGAALVAAALGLRHGEPGRANAGLGLFSALLVVRFFDEEVPTVVRGVVFIAIGLAFLAVNARLLRDRREVR